MTQLAGKRALITGGARGIGRAISAAYAAAGADVVVADLLGPEARDTASDIDGFGIEMDVTDLASIKAGVAEAEAKMGGIDILVNNAGIFNMASLDRITHEDYRRQYDINVGGTIFATQAIVPIMKRRGGGAIINFASQAGRRGEPNITVYCSTKAAVISVTQSLALELAGDNIRVNAIAPGTIDTDMVRNNAPEVQALMAKSSFMRRAAHADETVGLALYLASDASSFVTGTTINIDGGLVPR